MELATLMTSSINGPPDYRLSTETGVSTLDPVGLVSMITANPAAHGLGNVTNACDPAINECVSRLPL